MVSVYAIVLLAPLSYRPIALPGLVHDEFLPEDVWISECIEVVLHTAPTMLCFRLSGYKRWDSLVPR